MIIQFGMPYVRGIFIKENLERDLKSCFNNEVPPELFKIQLSRAKDLISENEILRLEERFTERRTLSLKNEILQIYTPHLFIADSLLDVLIKEYPDLHYLHTELKDTIEQRKYKEVYNNYLRLISLWESENESSYLDRAQN